MPSTYVPPDVTVTQKRRTTSAPRIAPQLPVVIIGPARQIKVREDAGQYQAGLEVDIPLPGLADGALVNAPSVEVLLDAVHTDGRSLGTFKLDVSGSSDSDGMLVGDNTVVRLFSSFALGTGIEHSLLSSRNNNLDTIDDEAAVGRAEVVYFEDQDIDFASLGVTETGNCFLQIKSPSQVIGRYKIVELVHDPVNVNRITRLRVEKVTGDLDEIELALGFQTAANPLAGDRTLRGFHTAAAAVPHVRALAAPNGFAETTQVGATYDWVQNSTPVAINGVATGGIGVDPSFTPVVMANADVAKMLRNNDPGAAVTAPGALSSAEVWFAPVNRITTGTPDPDDYGNNNPFWRAILDTAALGDWLRLAGEFNGAAGQHYRDFKIVAIDRINRRLKIVNPDGLTSDTSTVSLASAAGGAAAPLATIALLRCLRGRSDVSNGAGDALSFTSGSTTYRLEILRATPYLIDFVDAFPASLPAVPHIGFTVHRGVQLRNTDLAYDVRERLTTDFGGLVRISYVADRVDLAQNGLMDIANQQEIEDRIGLIHPNNPLALGADMVTRSGLTDGNRVFFALAIESDTVDGYMAALTTLETTDLAYYVVPLTQEKAVLSAYQAHVDSQSQPANKHERRLFFTTTLPTYDRIAPVGSTVALTGRVAVVGDPTPGAAPYTIRADTLFSEDLDWTTVKPGQMIKVLATLDTGSAVIEERRIKSVNSVEKTATVLTPFSDSIADPDGNNLTLPPTISFVVDTYPRSRLEQAVAWRDEAKVIADQRVCMIRPHQCLITYTDKTGVAPTDKQIVVPTYYAAAALAGLLASKPPQQPVTNMAVPGVDALLYSNTYFTPDQLNTIAEGGNLILVQASSASLPSVRHQLTSDMSTIELRELSINVAIDFCAYYFRTAYRPFIGKHNITNEFITQMRGIGEAVVRSLVEAGVVGRGSALRDVRQNKDAPDELMVDVDLQPLYPCNRISVTLYV